MNVEPIATMLLPSRLTSTFLPSYEGEAARPGFGTSQLRLAVGDELAILHRKKSRR